MLFQYVLQLIDLNRYCHPYFTLNRISRDMAIEAKSEEENEQHKA